MIVDESFTCSMGERAYMAKTVKRVLNVKRPASSGEAGRYAVGSDARPECWLKRREPRRTRVIVA